MAASSIMQLTFRPHHFLCTLCFQGSGYNAAFIKNYQHIIKQIELPETILTVTNHTDPICKPCPHRQGTKCATQDKIADLDTKHSTVLGFNIGDKLTWQAAKEKLAKNLSLDKFHKICHTCEWKTLGICEAQITSFLKECK